MLFSTVLKFLLATVPVINASPTPQSGDAGVPRLIFNGMHPLNLTAPEGSGPPVNPLVKRYDSCGLAPGNSQIFYNPDAAKLSNNLKTIHPNTKHWIDTQSAISWTYGNAKICILNKYIFEGSEVTEWEVGWAVGYILGKCCSGSWW
jgi:hypothetical protein